jgi:hypothetical protein
MLANATAQISAVLQSYGALAVLAAILLVGIWRITARLIGARQQARLTRDFRARFHAFANSSGEDTAAYERLAFLAERMANAMGRHGLVDATPPFTGRSAKKYVTVLQFIPELRMHFADERGGGYGLGNDGASWIYHTIDDALIRFLGALDATTKSSTKKLFNPIAWLSEGAERIVALPFYLAGTFGLIEPGRAAEVEQRTAFRAVAGLAALIVVVTVASILIAGEAQTAAAYRGLATTVARAIDGFVTALVSAVSDVARAITAPPEQ